MKAIIYNVFLKRRKGESFTYSEHVSYMSVHTCREKSFRSKMFGFFSVRCSTKKKTLYNGRVVWES